MALILVTLFTQNRIIFYGIILTVLRRNLMEKAVDNTFTVIIGQRFGFKYKIIYKANQ